MVPLKATFHGTAFAYDCCMRFLERELLASWKNRVQFPQYKIDRGYDCCRVLHEFSDAPFKGYFPMAKVFLVEGDHL